VASHPTDNRITLTLATGIYDIVQPLIHGLVNVEGIRLNVLTHFSTVDEIFRRMLKLEFDVSEMSLSHYFIARDRGMPIVALPVFLNRRFPHSYFFCRTDYQARTPKELSGKRVGLPQYQATRAMWLRGIFEDEYGLDRTAVTWVTDSPERVELGRAPGIKIERAPSGKTVVDLLLEGKLDATLFWSKPLTANVDNFFPDLKSEEIAYYQRTGIFPIMHTVVMNRELADRHPWMARYIVEAYSKSKNIAYAWRNKVDGGSMPLAKYAIWEQDSILGADPFPFDLKPNLKALETAARYSVKDEFVKPIGNIADLWVELE
jgi:4,5-dihydroxyphthalate decarboxylase